MRYRSVHVTFVSSALLLASLAAASLLPGRSPGLAILGFGLIAQTALLLSLLVTYQAWQQREAELTRELANLIAIDPLTGLPNRRVFFTAGHRMLKRRMPFRRPCMLVIWNLEGLREMNDRTGPESGDEVIVSVAQMLATAARPNDLVARVTGAQFAALLGSGGPPPSVPLGTQISQAVWSAWGAQGIAAPYTTALYPSDGETLESLFAAGVAATPHSSVSQLRLIDEAA